MDLGTGKDYDDYIVKGEKIPCHLVDILPPGEKYNVFEFQRDFFKFFRDIERKKKWPILCGGSGMYIEAAIQSYQMLKVPGNKELREKLQNKSMQELTGILSTYKKLHNTTDIDTRKRAIRAIEIEAFHQEHPREQTNYPKINSLNIGVQFDRKTVKERITARLKQRLAGGMIEEVENLLGKGLQPGQLIYYGLEYKYVTLYITGKLSYTEMEKKLNIAIHQFSKRQMTWYRRMERKGIPILWIDGHLPEGDKIDIILNALHQEN